VLARLDQIDGVERSSANRTGTLIRISVAPAADPGPVAGQVLEVLADEGRGTRRLGGSELDQALEREEWRDAGRVRELSQIEFCTLALRPLPWLAGLLAVLGVITLLKRSLLQPLHAASACLVIVLGVLHTAQIPQVFSHGLGTGALWFGGSGLALVLLGFLNVVLAREAGRDRLVRVLCHAANLAGILFAALVTVTRAEPHAFVGLVALLVMTGSALLRQRPDAPGNAAAAASETAGGSASSPGT
jgi:hypothetical protein